LHYTTETMNSASGEVPQQLPMATALKVSAPLDNEGFPQQADWLKAAPLRFSADWKGEKADEQRSTEVRLLWSSETLFVRFAARYRTITVFRDSRADGWRDELWDRDVAEVFLQPDASDPLRYKEFEISPNGFWIDLNISHGDNEEMHSGLRRRMLLDDKAKCWTAELALPMKSLTNAFDAKQNWRVNFYRVEGEKEPRFYSAWSPTYSEKPNFHVPERFGTLRFR